MLFLNLILIGFVVGLVTLLMLDRKVYQARQKAFDEVCTHLLDVRKDITQAFKYIRQSNSNQNKVMKIVRAADNAIKQSFINIDRDIEHLFVLQNATNKALKEGVDVHNRLTDVVYQNLQDIWCELSCDDCSDCPYIESCEKYNSGEERPINTEACPIGPSLGDTPIPTQNSKNVLTVTPNDNNEEKIQIIRDRMKSSGVPENIIDQFIDKVEKLIKSNSGVPITLVWDSLVPSNHSSNPIPENTMKPNRDKTNKLVDPNSKIVKSLNRLFELPSTDK